MNLITVILVVIVLWLVYALLQSYRRIEHELREIRVKCVMSPDKSKQPVDPMDSMKNTVVSGLSRLAASI